MQSFLIFSPFFYLFSLKLIFCYDYKESYFLQKVDHFGYGNEDFYKQRYLENFKYYNLQNGTIFFYTGNEGNIEMFANNTGFMWEIAEKFNAGLLFAEHRYYGKSMPYGNESFKNNAHLGFLTSEQALADFATLILHIKKTYPGAQTAPVIAFGGSYGGMLAAWARIKYPHFIDAAVASSAPIHQFTGMISCDKFNFVVTQGFADESPTCAKLIRKSWDALRELGQTESGAAFLSDTFKLCSPISSDSWSELRDWLANTWNYLAMTNYPYPTDFLNPIPGHPIRETCRHLTDGSLDHKALMVAVAKAASVFHNTSGIVRCNDLNSSGGADLGEKGWDYQACTEMVMPMCQNGVSDMFWPQPWNFTEFAAGCKRQFQVTPEPDKAYVMYGGRNISASSNILFSNGKLDPWYVGGILESLSDSLVAVLMEGAAHHLDLRASNKADPESVVEGRWTIIRYLHRWIAQARATLLLKKNDGIVL